MTISVISTLPIKDGGGTSRTFYAGSSDGTLTGVLAGATILIDSAGLQIVRFEDQASASADPGFVLLAKRATTPANTSDTNGDYEPLQVNGGRVWGSTIVEDIGAGDYETISASVSNQALGASGAAGDYLGGLLIVPATTSPGVVTISDGSSSPDTQITIFTGGANSVSNLVPFFVPLGIKSVTGAWRVTTGADVSVIASGNFT